MIVDAYSKPGGQLIKQPHKFFGSADICAGIRGIRLAEKLYNGALQNNCTFLSGSSVYAVDGNGSDTYRVYAGSGERTSELDAKALVFAAGAGEKALAFPGWTLPGVITAGAAQTLVNVYHVACGRRVLIVGAGNVGLIVAYQLLQAGIAVEAVIEAAPQAGGYEVHAAKIRRVGVPVLTGHTIVEARGAEYAEAAVIAQADEAFKPIPGTERLLAVDTICLAVGLLPLTRAAEAAGCEITAPAKGAEFFVRHDSGMRTSKNGIFVAGDAAGVDEASIAIEEGAVAGLYAAAYLGFLDGKTAGQEAEQHREMIRQIRSAGERKPQVIDYSLYKNLKKPKALIECFQEIPCNPCEKICPVKAITLGSRLSNLPKVSIEKCAGCGRCAAICPGQACFMLNIDYSENQSEICMPYEFLPLPEEGGEVDALDRSGRVLCKGSVLKTICRPEYDRTVLLHILVPKNFAEEVRGARPRSASIGGSIE
jgi:thioredoxin reductase/Fe-S-cluster-containing hydrogenase component 2